MSLQLYNQLVRVDNRNADSEIEDVKSIPLNGLACEYVASIMTTIGKDTLRSKQVIFSIVGMKEDGSAIEDGNGENEMSILFTSIDDAAYRFASNLAEMSKGVLSGLYKKMGKYRADVRPIDVPTGDNSSAVITMTNSEVSQYGNNHCQPYEEPFTDTSVQVFVPWVRDDVSRQDVIVNMENFQYSALYAGQTIQYTLGKVKFLDDDQKAFLAYQAPYMRNIRINQYSKALPGFKRNNDSALGGDDHVVSQEFNTVDSVGVDDGII